MIVCCGVGLEKAAAATQMLIENYKISRIIMSVTAGGADSELDIGDTEMVLGSRDGSCALLIVR